MGDPVSLRSEAESAMVAGSPIEIKIAIEVTSKMVDAGLNTLYDFSITEPEDDEMREAVTEVFKAMLGAM